MADFAIAPPIAPMLAKVAEDIPTAGDFLYEPTILAPRAT